MAKKDNRIKGLIEHIGNIATLDFSKQAKVIGDGSQEDELALRINMLAAKWEESVTSIEILAIERDQELERLFQQLNNSEEQYLNMVEKSPVGIILVEPNSGAIVDANQVLLDILGYSLNELALLNINDLIPDHLKAEREEQLLNLKKHSKVTFESERIHKNGSRVPVETTLSMNMYGDALPVIMAVVTDITERKKAKERLLSAIMSAEDNERERISSEIHNGLQQTLICASLQLEQIKAEDEEEYANNVAFNQGLDFLNTAINESRAIAHALLPKTVEDNGLADSLEEMVRRINLLSQVKISLKFDFNDSLLEISIALRLYNIIQEALNNALKHANASFIDISITLNKNKLELLIIDDGVGFEFSTLDTNKSFGLHSMQQKVKAISGELKIESAPGNGTNIRVEVPLAKEIEH